MCKIYVPMNTLLFLVKILLNESTMRKYGNQRKMDRPGRDFGKKSNGHLHKSPFSTKVRICHIKAKCMFPFKPNVLDGLTLLLVQFVLSKWIMAKNNTQRLMDSPFREKSL